MDKLSFLFGWIFLLLGCESTQFAQSLEEEFSELIPHASLGRGVQASLDTTTARMIAEPEEWAATTDSLQPLVPFTVVDFELEVVLLVAVEVEMGGYDLRLELVESLRDTVIVTYRLFSPGDDCRTSFASGIAFEAVRIPRTSSPVRFVQMDEARKCTPA